MPQRDGGTGQAKGQDPFRSALPLGSVGGIKIQMNWSVAVIFVLIALGPAAWQFPAVSPHQSMLTYVLAGLLTMALFASLYRKGHTSQLQRLQFRAEHFPKIVLSPQDATRLFSAGQIDYVPIDEVAGRIAATLALVYPPGIGVVVPGERWDERAAPMIDYLKLFQDSYALFPGFTNEIQGVYPEQDSRGQVRLFTYAIRE